MAQVFLALSLYRDVCGIELIKLARPQRNHAPAEFSECGGVVFVPGLVAGDFAGPIGGVGLWRSRAALAIMAVPETSVDEYYGAVFGKHQIRLAGQVFDIEPVAIAKREERLPDGDFGLCVFGFDRPHHRRAFFGRKNIAVRPRGHAAFQARRGNAGAKIVSPSHVTSGAQTPSPQSLSAAVALAGRI